MEKKKKKGENAPAIRRCSVGGQAVMEGVMMKSDVGIAMAVRRSDGKIIKSYQKFRSKAQKGTFWGLPVVRGVVAFVESLKTGMDTTTKSAELLGESFEEEPSKFEKWLADKLHIDIMSAMTAVAAVIGVALAVGLFMFLPQLIASLIFGKASGGADKYYVWRSLLEGVIRVGIYVGYLFAVKKDLAARKSVHASENVKERRLARTGLSDYNAELAFFYGKTAAVQCGYIDRTGLVDLPYILEINIGHVPFLML